MMLQAGCAGRVKGALQESRRTKKGRTLFGPASDATLQTFFTFANK